MTSDNNIYILQRDSLNMPNTLVSIRLPKDQLQLINKFAATEGFLNAQDFVRDAIRRQIEHYKLKYVEQELSKIQQMAKNNPRVRIATKKELDALARKLYAPIKSKKK